MLSLAHVHVGWTACVWRLLFQGPVLRDEVACGRVTGQARHGDLLDELHVVIDKRASISFIQKDDSETRGVLFTNLG